MPNPIINLLEKMVKMEQTVDMTKNESLKSKKILNPMPKS